MLAAPTLNDLSNHNYASSSSSYPDSSQPTTILPPPLAPSSSYERFRSHNSSIIHTTENQTTIQLISSRLSPISTPGPSIITSSTTVSYLAQLSFSSIKSQNNDIIVHNNVDYIKFGSSQPFLINDTNDNKENLPTDPKKWTVFQVAQFIGQLTNSTIGAAFYEHAINGRALLLLKEENLRKRMKIPLYPSIVILNRISKLRQRTRTFSS